MYTHSSILQEEILNDLIYVKYNQILKVHYDSLDVVFNISMIDIDASYEWLTVLGVSELTSNPKDCR